MNVSEGREGEAAKPDLIKVPERETIELYENMCAVCGVPFFQKARGRLRRTCSDRCRQKLYRIRHTERGVEQRRADPDAEMRERYSEKHRIVPRVATECPVCGGEIVQAATGRKRKTCSAKCRQKLWRYEHPRCLMCSKRFTAKKGLRNVRYCSYECQTAAYTAMRRVRRYVRNNAAYRHYRPNWWATRHSGYREESVPWGRGGEGEAVVRERKPERVNRRTPPPSYFPEKEPAESGPLGEAGGAGEVIDPWGDVVTMDGLTGEEIYMAVVKKRAELAAYIEAGVEEEQIEWVRAELAELEARQARYVGEAKRVRNLSP